MFRQALIIGVGLLGGSLAKALKENKIAYKVVGCSRSQETIREALKLGIIDGGSTEPVDFVKESDLVVFSIPMRAYASTSEKISQYLMPNAVLTDVGSVKRVVFDEALPNLSAKQRSLFVPGHPIAGGEGSGPAAADASLFKGKTVVLTPIEQTNKTICSKVEKMWSGLGANVIYMSPEKHDEIYANVSHLLQFLAYTYRLAFPGQSKNNDENFQKFFRIAKSTSGIWIDIFRANKDNISVCLVKFREAFLQAVEAADDEAVLPQLIAKAAEEVAGEYKPYGGSGFRDFTSASRSRVNCEQKITEVPIFVAMLDTLTEALANDTVENYLPTNG